MATYNNDLRLKEITPGDEDGTWGTTTNANLALIGDGFSAGTKQMAADANETFTIPDGTADATRSIFLKITSALTLTATRTITLAPSTVSKVWIIYNSTTGGQTLSIKQGSGAEVTVANGKTKMIYTDGAGAGAAVVDALNALTVAGAILTNVSITSGTITGITDLAVADGGTGASTAAAARVNLLPSMTANERKLLAVNSGATDAEWVTDKWGYELISAGTPTVSANYDLLTTFTSTYDEYLIVAAGLRPASDTFIECLFANAGVVDTGANYAWSFGTNAIDATGAPLTSTFMAGPVDVVVESSTDYGASFEMVIKNVNSALQLKTCEATGVAATASTPNTIASTFMTGAYKGGVVSGIRFYWDNGANFQAQGYIRVYGRRKS